MKTKSTIAAAILAITAITGQAQKEKKWNQAI